jgi:hypothetical protein
MCANPHKELKVVILDYLKNHPEAATMTFDEFYGEISKVTPCDRIAFAVTISLMSLLEEIDVTKDEQGRGRGFALPSETPSSV